jgi:hypothetical protein
MGRAENIDAHLMSLCAGFRVNQTFDASPTQKVPGRSDNEQLSTSLGGGPTTLHDNHVAVISHAALSCV